MCLILAGYGLHPTFPLVVAANRDEFYARPAAPAHFWEQFPDLFAGQDLSAGGTWMGIGAQGRWAALTNYRDPAQPPVSLSRGLLVRDYLTSALNPEEFWRQQEKEPYGGCNLLLWDGRGLSYAANRGAPWRLLTPGLYGLSNHLLDTPWPKVVRAKAAFARALADLGERWNPGAVGPFLQLLADTRPVPDQELPHTGVSLDWERALSPIFIRTPDYGTRVSTVLALDQTGCWHWAEQAFGPEGALGTLQTWEIPPGAHGPEIERSPA